MEAQSAVGPLSQMKEFQVLFCADDDQKVAFSFVVESLKHLGSVQIASSSGVLFNSDNEPPALVIFVADEDENAHGSIRLFAEVAVQPSQYKIVSQVWTFGVQNEGSVYPFEENGQVIFKKKEVSNDTKHSQQSVISKLVAEFGEQYHRDNPENVKPIFLVQCIPSLE